MMWVLSGLFFLFFIPFIEIGCLASNLFCVSKSVMKCQHKLDVLYMVIGKCMVVGFVSECVGPSDCACS